LPVSEAAGRAITTVEGLSPDVAAPRRMDVTSISMAVNGQMRTIDVDPDMPLLWVLRDILGLTGTKYGCGIGACGTCTVHVDGEAIRSCAVPVSQVAGRAITTIEGISPDGTHPLQRAWIAENVSQCGYCQPGQIMTAAAFLAKNPEPSNDEIDDAMSGVLCRCGTYQRIRRAIHRAVEEGDAR
jgi:aerobic-type carbon monoxide dehydrogenase small subunit (CoxS/CutS family)